MYLPNNNKRAVFAAASAFFLAALYVFSGIIFYPGYIPGYRDASQFYYPLFLYLQDCFHSGEIPLWTPYFNLGFPLVANATTALFYSPCWILALPIPPWLAFNAYIMGHTLFAGWSMFFCLRKWNRSVSGSALGAASYALGGIVLFQYSNLIYLVSASWLPLGLYAFDSVLRKPTLKRIFFSGAVLAFMTLGGDVQTAYNLGIIALMASVIKILFLNRKRAVVNTSDDVAVSRFRLFNKTVTYACILAAVALAGFALAAVQIIPSLELACFSDRFSTDASIAAAEVKYNFSLPPWRLAEFFIPEFSGRQFPVYSRWIDVIPGSDTAAWVVSLYMGTIPFLLACFAFRFRNGSSLRVWISWIVIIALAASMGRMSVGYFLQTVGFWTESEYFRERISSGWGGVYWLMSVIFPGYDAFRYPAKWLTVAAAGISVLSAFGWDSLWKRCRTQRYFAFVCVGMAGIIALWACIAGEVIPHYMSGLYSCSYGPYSASFPVALLFSAAGLLIASGLILFSKNRNSQNVKALIVLLVVADGAFYSARLIAPVPAWIWEKDETCISLKRTCKIGDSWLPESFKSASSPNRETELARWNFVSLCGYNSLYRRAPDMRYGGTVMLSDYSRFLEAGRRQGRAAELPLCSLIAKKERDDIVVLTSNKKCWQDGKMIPTPQGEISGEKLVELALDSPVSSCVLEHSANRILLKIQADNAGTLAMPCQYYPGWHARLSWIETDKYGDSLPVLPGRSRFHKAPVYKIGGVFQAVDIPASGTWTVELTYRPTSLIIGLIVSSLAWIYVFTQTWSVAHTIPIFSFFCSVKKERR